MNRRALKSLGSHRIDPAADEQGGHPEVVLVILAGAVSGAIVGFLLAGEIALGLGIFVAAVLGLLGGWWARGISGDGVE